MAPHQMWHGPMDRLHLPTFLIRQTTYLTKKGTCSVRVKTTLPGKTRYVLPNIHLLNYFSYQTMSKDLHAMDVAYIRVFSPSLLSSRLWFFCATVILYHMEDLLEVPAILCAGSFPTLGGEMICPPFHGPREGQQRRSTWEHFHKCKG